MKPIMYGSDENGVTITVERDAGGTEELVVDNRNLGTLLQVTLAAIKRNGNTDEVALARCTTRAWLP